MSKSTCSVASLMYRMHKCMQHVAIIDICCYNNCFILCFVHYLETPVAWNICHIPRTSSGIYNFGSAICIWSNTWVIDPFVPICRNEKGVQKPLKRLVHKTKYISPVTKDHVDIRCKIKHISFAIILFIRYLFPIKLHKPPYLRLVVASLS